MKVAVTGSRVLEPEDVAVIESEMRRLVSLPDLIELRFGGAVGADTEALRIAFETRKPATKLVVYLPLDVDAQPVQAQLVIARCADEVMMNCGFDAKEPFRRRNEMLVHGKNLSDPVDRVVAFWSGKARSGTLMTANIARKAGIDVEPVGVGRLRGNNEWR